MKKLFKILLITVIALSVSLCVVACNQPAASTEIGVIEGNAGEYEQNIGTAYGAKPDLDTVVIDGILDDELWQGKKWYTQYESTHKTKFQVTTAMSPKGFYLAASCNDNFIYWNGYNYFFSNTNFSFQFYAGNNTYITADANNTRVTHKFINLRSRIGGQYNLPGKGGGMVVEFFIPWEELGIDVSKGLPASIKILPLYNYPPSPDSVTEALYPTFVKTTGDSGQVPKFGANGYLDGDEDEAIVGSHKGGKGRTNGWTITDPGTENETATSSATATANFAQAAFFRNLTSSTFRISAKIKVKDIGKDARVGLMIYKDDINYRAVALSISASNFAGGKMSKYVLKGYTNYPHRITEVTDLVEVQPTNGPTDEIELSLYNKSGNLYYIVNGKYAYSEDASYAGLNAFAGFYAFNTTAQFSDYTFTDYETEQEFDEEMAKYAYLVNIRTEGAGVTVTTDQLAVSREADNVLTVTTTFKNGYTMDENKFEYTIGRQTKSMHDLYMSEAQGGVLVMRGITGNIEIRAKARKVTDSDNVTVEMPYVVKDAMTGEVIKSADVTLYGTHPYSRYNQLFIATNSSKFNVRPGETWKYEVTSSGYRDSKGELLGGATVNQSLTQPAEMIITNSVVGGIAESVLKPDGTPKSSISAISNPGTMWDLSRESESKAVFQTSTNDRDVVFFSGRTVSDFQVAYVEIINRTDPASFSSFENDPAAGFILKSGATESFMGLRKTGLRLKKERNNWTAGTYVDTNNDCPWPGYLGNTDRDNGGRFINAYEGNGTVDRIPWDGKEYTNSFLMIRRGPYLYFYACDGSALVDTNAKNFSKLKLVGSFYNDTIPECAAIGLTCTVAYNLRMDFENYWILTDEKASQFLIKANLDLVTPFEMSEGKKLITLGGDGLIGYDDSADVFDGSIIKNGEVTIKARGQVEAGKLIKVTFSDGTVKYISDTRTTLAHTPSPVSGKITCSAAIVDAIEIKGKISFPSGVSAKSLAGEVRDESGVIVTGFNSSTNGDFKLYTEAGFKGSIIFNLEGYISRCGALTGVAQSNLNVTFEKSTLGGSINFDGNAIDTANGGKVRSDGYGIIFEYENEISGRGNLVLTEANKYKGDFSLSFTYMRYPAGTKKEDADPSIGVRFFQGNTASLECMFIGNGYRVYHDYDGGFNSRDEKRGVSPVNMQSLSAMPYDFKVVKVDSIVYMFAKQHSASSYTMIYYFDLYKFMSTEELGFTIGWFSFGYNKMVVSDVVLSAPTADDLAALSATAVIDKNEGGNVVIEGATDNKVTLGKSYKIKITPESGKRVASVEINGKQMLDEKTANEVSISFVASASDKITVRFESEVYRYTATAGRQRLESSRYVKAVCNGVTLKMKFVSNEADLSESTAFVSGSQITLYLPEGEWTLTFYSDEAMTKQSGDALTVTVTRP